MNEKNPKKHKNFAGTSDGYYTVNSWFKNKNSTEFALVLEQYHPGIPGYDVKYRFHVNFKQMPLNEEDYTISCDIPEVKIGADYIVVPVAVMQTKNQLVVTAVYNTDQRYKSELTIWLKKWDLTLEDNFDTYNTELWAPYGEIWSAKYPDSYARALDNYVRNGNLCIDLKKENYVSKDGKLHHYTEGAVSTAGRFSQIYGCFTAKMKMPTTETGILAAFWLMPEGHYGTDYFFQRSDTSEFWGCSEIDIVETYKLTKVGSQHTEHYWTKDGKTRSQLPKYYKIPNFKYDDYQEFSCVWNERGVYYYVNGELAAVNENITPVDKTVRAYLVFSAYNGLADDCWFGTLEDNKLPQTMYVDWIRVYQ